jgi:hypothetical protein
MPGRELPELEERLRLLPAAMAVRAPDGLAERVARRGRRRRRLRRAAAAAVVAALVAGAVLTRAAVLDHTPAPVLDPGLVAPQATPAQLAAGHWRALPVLPPGQLAERAEPVVAWTGRQLIVFGGYTLSHSHPLRIYADGAAYDPATQRWTVLPPAPEGQWLESGRGPRGQGLAVWTGRELLVWGGYKPDPRPNYADPSDGVAYDPARRAWRKLAPRPRQLPFGSDAWVVWTGRALLVGEVSGSDEAGRTVAGAYDPATNRWRLLPPSPAITGGRRLLAARTVVWTGSRLLVWSFLRSSPLPSNVEVNVEQQPDSVLGGIDLWAWDPDADRWEVLPDPPDQVRQVAWGASLAWTGRDVAIASVKSSKVVAGKPRATTWAGRYDPDTGAWTPIAPPPRPGGRDLRAVKLAWTGGALLEPGNAAYDPAGDRWLPLPAAPGLLPPPQSSGDAARALVRLRWQPSGALQVYVLAPAKRP